MIVQWLDNHHNRGTTGPGEIDDSYLGENTVARELRIEAG